MTKFLLDFIYRFGAAIAAVVVVFFLIVAAAFVGVKFASPGGLIQVSSVGPTVKQLESIGELATVRVTITDILTATGEGYRGSWFIKGDALLCSDMSKAEVAGVDRESRTATIRLPVPRALSARVDHEKSRTWSVEKDTWIPWKWGDEDLFRDSAMIHAQRLIEEAANSEEHIGIAKAQAELTVRKTYELVDWHVTVDWQ